MTSVPERIQVKILVHAPGPEAKYEWVDANVVHWLNHIGAADVTLDGIVPPSDYVAGDRVIATPGFWRRLPKPNPTPSAA